MLGYIRAGGLVEREEEPVPPGPNVDGCGGGKWYAVKPAGFVCEGHDGVTLDLDDPVVKVMQKYPPRGNDPLPYGYGMSMSTPMYSRVPTPAEQKQVEGDIAGRTKQIEEQRAKLPPDKLVQWPELALPLEPMPDFLADHAQVPIILPWVPNAKTLKGSYAIYQTRLGFLSAFEAEGRTWYLTTEMLLVPADRIHANRTADFHGVELAKAGAEGVHLPVAWVRWGTAPIFKLDTVDGGTDLAATPTTGVLPLQGWAEIAAKPLSIKGSTFFEIFHGPAELGDRLAVRTSDVTRVDVVKELPERVEPTETWIDVDVAKQTLVLYDGLVPRFVTLVATGAGKGHETPLGRFRVYSKHVTSRMSAEEKPAEKEGDQPEHAYRYDDVPYVQFLHEGIALHAAFWHEGFGIPRSHGCINLSPRDAVWLFHQTLPAVPDGWHSINAGRAGIPWGTMVHIHY
jgi:hypothetical protein